MSRTETNVVDFVVPRGFDQPELVSGGNVFDRHVRDGLARIGWVVRCREIDLDAAVRVAPAFSHLPDGGVVLIDGLVANRWPAAVAGEGARLRIVVIAHMVAGAFSDADPRTVEAERRVLEAARRVIATSAWTRAELIRRVQLPPDRVVVVTPGTDDAPEATGTPAGGALLCVGVVAPHKGQDTLIDALASLGGDLPWTCTIAGSVDADPEFASRIARRTAAAGLDHRVTITGVLAGAELGAAYQRADLLVAPSRTESYGLAIADARRRGIPVVASRVGGIPDTVGADAALLVAPDDPGALSSALERWMLDPGLRASLQAAARGSRSSLPRWSDTARAVAATLAGV